MFGLGWQVLKVLRMQNRGCGYIQSSVVFQMFSFYANDKMTKYGKARSNFEEISHGQEHVFISWDTERLTV